MQLPASPLDADASALRARLRQLEALFEHSLDAIVVMRPDGTVIDVNPAACRLHDIPRCDLVGGHLLSVVPTPLHEAVLAGVAALVQGHVPVGEAVVLDRSGTEIPVEIRATSFEYDGEDAVLLQVRDVRARKAAEASARRQEQLLRHVVESTPVFLFAVNALGEVTLAEGRSLKDVHLQSTALLGTAYRQVLNRRMAHALRDARDAAQQGIPTVCQIPVGSRTFECWVLPDDDGILGIATDQTDLIVAKEAAENLGEQLRALAQYENAMLEAERARISRETHDVLGQALTAIRMEVDQVSRILTQTLGAIPDAIVPRCEAVRTLTDEAIANVRRIAADLRPPMLDDLGLGPALAWLVKDFGRRTGIESVFDGEALDLPLTDEQATAFFRVAQELLTNVARHAHATRVNVHLTYDAFDAILEVIDNGEGFSPDPDRPYSLGLLGMRERLLPLNGLLSYADTPGGGTTATVLLPFHAAVSSGS